MKICSSAKKSKVLIIKNQKKKKSRIIYPSLLDLFITHTLLDFPYVCGCEADRRLTNSSSQWGNGIRKKGIFLLKLDMSGQRGWFYLTVVVAGKSAVALYSDMICLYMFLRTPCIDRKSETSLPVLG